MADDRGTLINRECRLGALILSAAERLEALQKLARKTPPKTLLAERRKVDEAKLAVGAARSELRALLSEHADFRAQLGCDDRGLSNEYLAIRARYALDKEGGGDG